MNYDEISISNYFRVTDENKLDELEKDLFCIGNYEREINVAKFKDEKGNTYRKYSCYGSLEYGSYDDSDLERFYKELQKILPESEVFVLMYIGYEGLRYVVSGFTVVTKDKIDYRDVDELIQEVVGLPDFNYRKFEGCYDEGYMIDPKEDE